MKFKKGQPVYFFKQTGEFSGQIIRGSVKEATKDLLTGKVWYIIDCLPYGFLFAAPLTERVSKENLYTNIKKLKKDYRELIMYGDFLAKIDKLEKFCAAVVDQCADKIDAVSPLRLTGAEFSGTKVSIIDSHLYKNGRDLIEEIDSMKATIEDIKKKIKKPGKKPVIKL